MRLGSEVRRDASHKSGASSQNESRKMRHEMKEIVIYHMSEEDMDPLD